MGFDLGKFCIRLIIFLLAVALFLVFLMTVGGCISAPVERGIVMPMDKDLLGWSVVIVPQNTYIGQHKTEKAGVYIETEQLRGVINYLVYERPEQSRRL